MSGSGRTEQTSKARTAVAGALTAGALLLAPVGAAVVWSPAGSAYAAPDTGTYDELVEVHSDGGSVASIVDDDGLQADTVTDSTSWVPGSVSGH
jgi:hypothetical protein